MFPVEVNNEATEVPLITDKTEPSLCKQQTMAPLNLNAEAESASQPQICLNITTTTSVPHESTSRAQITFEPCLPEILLTPDKTESTLEDTRENSVGKYMPNLHASYNSLLHWRRNLPKDNVEYLMNKYTELQGVIFGVDLPLNRMISDAAVRKTQTLGLLLAGHRDLNQMSVFVCGLRPGSIADRDGRIEIGDQLLEVNGHTLYGLSHLNAASVIRSAYLDALCSQPTSSAHSKVEHIRFVVQRHDGNLDLMAAYVPTPMEIHSPKSSRRSSTDTVLSAQSTASKIHLGTQSRRSLEMMSSLRSNGQRRSLVQETFFIRLIRGSSGFGFAIMEGNSANEPGIYVKQIVEGGPAAKDGQLCPGDRILRVNRKQTTDASYDTVMEWIRAAKYELRLQVSRWCFEPHKPSSNDPVASGFKRLSAPQLYDLPDSKTGISDKEFLQRRGPGDPVESGSFKRFLLQTVLENDGPSRQLSPARIPTISRRVSSPACPLDKSTLNPDPTHCTSPRSSLIPSCGNTDGSRGSLYRSVESVLLDANQAADRCPINPGIETEIHIQVSGSMGLGIGFIGGSETSLNYIAVHEIYAKGAALLDGRLRPGDRIVCVNSTNLVGVPFIEAVKQIHSAYHQAIQKVVIIESDEDASSKTTVNKPVIKMTVLRPNKLNDVWYDQELVVHLTKKAGRGLGICIADRCVYLAKTQGINDFCTCNDKLQKQCAPSYGVIITDLIKGSPAAMDGRLLINDQIISVNGEETTEYTSEVVGALIKKATNKVTLKIRRLRNQVTLSAFHGYI